MNQPRPTSPAAVQPPTVEPAWGGASPQGGFSMQPQKKKSRAWIWALGILGLGVLLCGGGVAGFFVYVASVADTNNGSYTNRTSWNSSTNRSTTPSPATSPNGVPVSEEVDLSVWVRNNSVWGTTEFTNGEFFMAAKEKGYYYVLVAPDDYKTDGATTRVTVRNPDAADSNLGYGLIVHSDTTPLQKDYAFLIDSKRQRYRVVRHSEEDEASVTPWTNSKLINEGTADNVIEVRDKSGKIDFYINGQMATSVANKQGPAAGVPGLYAGDGVKVGFKKLEITKSAPAAK